ncbi:hypothetical protein OIV83_000583 [Microbotryomycetes sp. JL201]|nr:hypothetical protein OIV83_000583 [Microbotryomycetes sp. JL201]
MLFSVASVLALAASTRAAPIAASLAAVEAALSLPNTTQTNEAVFYYQNGNAGACGLYSQDSDLVVGLPYEFYNETGLVSPYCGKYIVVRGVQTNKTVTARVADASATNGTLSMSVAAWRAIDGDSGLKTVKWRFANATETEEAKAALESDDETTTVAAAPSTTARAATTAAARTTTAATTTSEYVAPTTTTTTSEYVAPTTTTTTAEWTPESTSEYVAPTTTTTTSEWVAPTTTTEQPQATQQQSYQSDSSASSGSYSGTATYFFQGGAAGNCGTVHSDSDYIVALTTSMYSGGSHCGQGVHICSTSTGRCVDATVADSCPSCSSSGDLDLSEAAFNAIASPSDGVTPISWSFS